MKLAVAVLTSLLYLFSPHLMANPNQYKVMSKIHIDGELVSVPMIMSLENEYAELSQRNDDGGHSLRIKVVPNNNEFIDADVVVEYNIELTDGSSTRSIQSRKGLNYGMNERVIYSELISTVNDEAPVRSTIEIESKVIKL